MQERREFLKMVSAGSTGALLANLFAQTGSQTVYADVEKHADAIGQLPDNLIYTEERSGKWKGKAGSHVPQIKAVRHDNKISLEIETKHGMSERHYIVRHTVVTADGQVLGGETFHWDDKPISNHEMKLPQGQSQDLYVLSYCNKHDLWLARTQLK